MRALVRAPIPKPIGPVMTMPIARPSPSQHPGLRRQSISMTASGTKPAAHPIAAPFQIRSLGRSTLSIMSSGKE